MFNWSVAIRNLCKINRRPSSVPFQRLDGKRVGMRGFIPSLEVRLRSWTKANGRRRAKTTPAALIEHLEPRALLSAAPVNLLTNSSFESGAANWSWAVNGGAAANYSIDATVAHSDFGSVKLSNSSPLAANVWGAFTQNVSGLTVGSTYFVSAWVKGAGVGSSAQILANPDWSSRTNIPSGTFDWTQVQMSFVAKATTVPISLIVQDPTNSLWIDDVSVTASGSLIGNGGFEGGTSSWAWSTNGTISASNTIDTSTFHSGSSSLKLTDSTPYTANTYALFSQNISGLTVGNTYYVSAWVKGSGVGTAEQILTNSDWATRLTLPSGTYDWTQVRLSFVAQATSVPIQFAVQDVTSALWVDDVVVTDSPNLVSNSSFNQNSSTSFSQNGITGWNFFTAGGAAANSTLDPSNSHWLGGSAQLTNSSGFAGGVYGALTQYVSGLTVGKTYTLNAYVRGSGVGTAEQLATNTNWATRLTLPSGTYGWTLQTLSFVADATTVPVSVILQDPTAGLWIDDLTVTDPTAVVNANFSNSFGTVSTATGIEQIGVGWNRIDAAWQYVERTQGLYDWSALDSAIAESIARGASPEVILESSPTWANPSGNWLSPPDLNAYSKFVTAAVNRYKNVVHVWEVWNEENAWFFTGSTGQYVNILKTGYTAAKLADPSCTVLLGGVFGSDSSYLSTVYQLGGGQYFDAVSAHPYQNMAVSDPAWFTYGLTSMRNVMNANADTSKAIWLTEIGWSVNTVSQQQQAENLVQTYVNALTLKSMGVTETFWYSGPNRSDNFGLQNSDGTNRGSYWAYLNLVNLLGTSTYQGAVPLGTGVQSQAFKLSDGSWTLAIWSPNSTSITLSTSLVGNNARFRDLWGNLLTVTQDSSGYHITSNTAMIYVTKCASSLFSSAVIPSYPSYTPGSSSNPAPLPVWASVVEPTTTQWAYMATGKTNSLQVYVQNQGTASATGTINVTIPGLTKPAAKSYSLAAGANVTLTFSFSVPSSMTKGSLLLATVTGTEKIGSANSVAMKSTTSYIRITGKNSVEFIPGDGNIESQYLYDAGPLGTSANYYIGQAARSGSYYTYLFDLTGTTSATLTGTFGSNNGGAWQVQASSSPTGPFTTVASGTGTPSSQTINLNAFAGKKVYLKFVDPTNSYQMILNNLSLISW